MNTYCNSGNGRWYYVNEYGDDMGPYNTQEEAETAYNGYYDNHYLFPSTADIQYDAEAFMNKFGQPVGERPGDNFDEKTRYLRAKLVLEEATEFVEALGFYVNNDGEVAYGNPAASYPNLPEAMDAVADLIYVAIGAAVSFGVNLGPIWAAVQRTNMAKVGGGSRSDGKVMKPPGWQAPDVASLLKQQGWNP